MGGMMLCAVGVAALICAVSCNVAPTSEPVTFSEVVGLYRANYKAGLIELLDLRKDSTYSYRFVGFDSLEFALEGSWTFAAADGITGPYVRLRSFLVPYPVVGFCYSRKGPPELLRLDTLPYNYWINVFKDGRGRIALERCPDDNQYYMKIQ